MSNQLTAYTNVMKIADSRTMKIAEASPAGVNIQRIFRSISQLMVDNTKLQKCTPLSIFMCASSSAMMGLELSKDMGEAYLVPYGDVCQLQPSYKGLIKLALRHPDIKGISCRLVYENDDYDFNDGIKRSVKHHFDPFMDDRGNLIGVYASYETMSGYYDFETMNMMEVQKVKSKSKGGNIWNEWYEEMVKKSALRRLCKRIPKTIELSKALDFDMNLETARPQDHGEVIDVTGSDGLPDEKIKPTGKDKNERVDNDEAEFLLGADNGN